MTWTYVPDFTLNRDKVRLLIGDTDTNNQLLTDEELCFLESEFGSATNVYSTALAAIDVAMVEVARKASSKSVGPLSISYSNRMSDLSAARARIAALVTRKASPTPYAGGISVADKDANESDDDNVAHSFRIGMFDGGGADDADLTKTRDRDDV